MSTFYGQVEGMGKTSATRTGSKASHIRASVQSTRKSVITEMYYNGMNELCLRVEVANGTKFAGSKLFDELLDDFIERLEA